MMRVEVKSELLHWAIERAGDRSAYLYEKFPHLDEWERGEAQPTLKQLESFAKAAIGVKVKCMTPYEMLRHERAKFVLGKQP